MKKAGLFLSVFLGVISWYSSIAQVTFQKSYGDVLLEYGSTLYESAAGGYLVGGAIGDSAGNNNILLIRTDVNGDTLWTRELGNLQNEELNSLVETNVADIIVTGSTDSDMLMMKLSMTGSVLWSRKFGFNSYEGGKSTIAILGGGYALTGCKSDSGKWKPLLINTDFAGITQWIQMYGSTLSTYGKGVIQTPNQGFVITGDVTEQNGSTVTDYFVIRTDQNGDTLWTRSYGFPGLKDNAHAIINVPGGYVIAGFTAGGPNGSDLFLHRLDENGILVWAKTYLGTTFTTYPVAKHMSLDITDDGGYFFTGKQNAGNNFAIFRTDSSGNLLWSRSALGPEGQAVCGISTQDGGYIVTGTAMFWTGFDIVLFKTDSLGWSGCNEQNMNAPFSSFVPQLQSYPFYPTAVTDTLIPCNLNITSGAAINILCASIGMNEQVFHAQSLITPNPFISEINFSGLTPGTVIGIFDISGKQILEKIAESESFRIQTDSWSQGCYIVKITDESGVVVKKLIK